MTNHANQPHVLPLRVYLTVGSILLTLTVVTVWVASYDLGTMNLVVAMIIAAVKGTLVALYFMHLRYDNKLYSLFFGTAIIFLAIFIIITMFDTLHRDDIYDFRAAPVHDRAAIYAVDSIPAMVDSSAILDSSAISDTVTAPTESPDGY